jgi:hypothetical protein
MAIDSRVGSLRTTWTFGPVGLVPERVNSRSDRTIRVVPSEQQPQERELRPLGRVTGRYSSSLGTRAPQQLLIRLDRNDDQLDPIFAGRRVEVQVSPAEITATLLDTSNLAAWHKRIFVDYQTILDPAGRHSVTSRAGDAPATDDGKPTNSPKRQSPGTHEQPLRREVKEGVLRDTRGWVRKPVSLMFTLSLGRTCSASCWQCALLAPGRRVEVASAVPARRRRPEISSPDGRIKARIECLSARSGWQLRSRPLTTAWEAHRRQPMREPRAEITGSSSI